MTIWEKHLGPGQDAFEAGRVSELCWGRGGRGSKLGGGCLPYEVPFFRDFAVVTTNPALKEAALMLATLWLGFA